MEESQLSLTEFSKELGIGKSSLQAYLNCQQNMRSDTIELIAERMGITPAELVSGKKFRMGTTDRPCGRK